LNPNVQRAPVTRPGANSAHHQNVCSADEDCPGHSAQFTRGQNEDTRVWVVFLVVGSPTHCTALAPSCIGADIPCRSHSSRSLRNRCGSNCNRNAPCCPAGTCEPESERESSNFVSNSVRENHTNEFVCLGQARNTPAKLLKRTGTKFALNTNYTIQLKQRSTSTHQQSYDKQNLRVTTKPTRNEQKA
jgi:hypothetical protein